uniref:(northern house mosquito) hypothetical protein n=1 Tax=Culex pipiens TaxID=7175 RepID=A0A8D8FJ74_CULPI
MYPANPGIVGSANQWSWWGHRGWPAGLHGEGSTESGQGKWRKQVVAMFVSLQGNAQQDHRQEGRCRDGEGTAAVHHPVVRQAHLAVVGRGARKGRHLHRVPEEGPLPPADAKRQQSRLRR